MQFIQPADRQQIEIVSLESAIGPDNVVRLIDAFAEKLDLELLGFDVRQLNHQGRPAFESRVFVKLYFYGYMNGLRSSRILEKECGRNIEVQWLIGRLTPNYHTIADFRKDNPNALRQTFQLFVSFLKDAKLIEGKTIAIDGTKVRAHNGKKNNYNPKKIERHLKYIEQKTNEYLGMLDEMDRKEQPHRVKDVKEKIQRLKGQKIKYEALGHCMEANDQVQVSTTDPDSRALLVQGQVVEVCYNTQTAVDEKHKLIVATHTINRNDRNAMSAIALEAKHNLQSKGFTAILDKGYHNGREIQACKDASIQTICAHAAIVNSNEKGTTPDYLVSKFTYNKKSDTYTCPQGHTLHTTGTWHTKTRERDSHQFRKFRTPKCKTCPVKHLCTGRADGRREIERSEFADAIEENNKRYHQHQDLYRKRQEINEHIFGTIKRKWGYHYTNLIGLEKVNGEQALIMTVYNFKRVISILQFKGFMEALKKWKPNYKAITLRFLTMDFKTLRLSPSILILRFFTSKIQVA